MFGGKDAHKVILEMDNDGLIDILFPIMLDVKKVPANSHHHLDLFNHSVETVKQIQSIYENSLNLILQFIRTSLQFVAHRFCATLAYRCGFRAVVRPVSLWFKASVQ